MRRGEIWVYQVRCASQQRLIKQVGTLSDETMKEISNALAIVLSIS
jgi:mRNA-degrading endonuclease toxin of MazEF toxin-antitoxin module